MGETMADILDADPTEADLYAIAEKLVREATASGKTVGTAESCTGGLVAAAITAVPGSSAALRGGIVSYAIPVKHAVLGVAYDVLDAPGIGAVSSECAGQMCQGARRVLECDVAVSITGIAGPGGEEPGKPVGTVWFGVTDGTDVHTECHLFSGDRAAVRRKAVACALGLLRSKM